MAHFNKPLFGNGISGRNFRLDIWLFLAEIIAAMSDTHPMLRWAERNGKTVPEIAASADCSESHLRNIVAGRKEASLGLAKRLSDLTDGEVSMEAFLRPEPVGARE